MPGPHLTRRRFLQALAGVATVGIATPLYAFDVEPFWVNVADQAMPIVGLPATLQGKTLVQISDLHIGPEVDDRYMARALRLVSSLEPDVLVITGDFMTSYAGEQVPHVMSMLEHLRPGRLATLAVLGNHDYGGSWDNPRAADRLTDALCDRGVTVLRNQRTEVAGLQVVGIDDKWSTNYHPHWVMHRTDFDRPTLVLAHNPDSADDRHLWRRYRGWILSGHTHGGQVSVPFYGPPILPVGNKRYTSGLIPLADGRRLYINPGLGYTMQVRFGVPPEITRFRLQRAS